MTIITLFSFNDTTQHQQWKIRSHKDLQFYNQRPKWHQETQAVCLDALNKGRDWMEDRESIGPLWLC